MQGKTDKQISGKNEEISRILNRVFNHFREGHFEEAIDLLEEALKIDFEYFGVTAALKCATFWQERKERLDGITGTYEQGEFLFAQWELFSIFLAQVGETSEHCIYNVKQYVFGHALQCFLDIFHRSGLPDPELLLKIGRCYKVIGDYDKAIEYLGIANQQIVGSADIIAELADCYSLINETRNAKALFREAFFIDPSRINLQAIEAGMIQKLLDKIRERDIPEDEISEWVGVFGTIFGLFSITRELRPLELGKLKQSIYNLEKEVQERPEAVIEKKPRLLNHYFWLIDHFITTGDDQSKIDEVLRKIRLLDPAIYNEYIQ
ncbi:MAG: tetratricopeptide repeat protein [Spirochaetales bacterium]|nr:tetratricopeptide repeat protein [Spirochaetales bacterium]